MNIHTYIVHTHKYIHTHMCALTHLGSDINNTPILLQNLLLQNHWHVIL